MKTYFNRTIVVGETEVTRKVVEKNGVAIVRLQGQDKPVEPVNGSALNKSTKWRIK